MRSPVVYAKVVRLGIREFDGLKLCKITFFEALISFSMLVYILAYGNG